MGCKIRGEDNAFLSALLFCFGGGGGGTFKETEIVIVKSGAVPSENNL